MRLFALDDCDRGHRIADWSAWIRESGRSFVIPILQRYGRLAPRRRHAVTDWPFRASRHRAILRVAGRVAVHGPLDAELIGKVAVVVVVPPPS